MGKKKGRQHQDDAVEQVPAPSSLGDFLDFPSLGGLSDALPDPASNGDSTGGDSTGDSTNEGLEVHRATAPSPITPPELTAEELEARHKKEKRELEGAARAARKAAGKSKVKTEEAEAAAEQAMDALRVKHARELLGFQLRPEGADPGCLQDTEAARTGLVGIKEILAGPRSRDAVSAEDVPLEELRIDTSDGNAYPLSSFLDVYGDEEGQRRWAVSPQSGQPGRGRGNGSCVPYAVMGSKKGGFPVSVEKRSRGKTVTVIHNVSGDVGALLAELKGAVGAGGLVREGDVEVQGDHLSKIEALLVKLGCVKGVTHSNIAAATAAGMATSKGCKAPGKSIPRLDKKAAQPGR